MSVLHVFFLSLFGNVLRGPAGLRCSWALEAIHSVAWARGAEAECNFV